MVLEKIVASSLLLTIVISCILYCAPKVSGELGASYTVWRSGSMYYAEDANGTIPSWGKGQNASMIINDALSSLTSSRTWEERVLIIGNITITSPLIVQSYTALQLDGTISLANNLNSDLVKSADFDSLTRTNSTGGIHDVEFTGGVYSGNFENRGSSSTIGYGFEIYGERYILENVEVRNCTSGGIYSQWANSPSVTPSTDAMESMWTNVRTCFNGGNGITMRGPHDSVFTNCITYCNNGRGISIEESANYTGGGLQLVNFHSYGNRNDGIWSDAWFMGSSVESESNPGGTGVCILHNDVHLTALHIYNNSGYAIQIGDATHNVSGVMIEAKTLSNAGCLKIVNGSGNSYTITCWEDVTISGNLSQADEYNIFNTKRSKHYESTPGTPYIDELNGLWFWPAVGGLTVAVVTVAYLQRRPRKKEH